MTFALGGALSLSADCSWNRGLRLMASFAMKVRRERRRLIVWERP